RGGARLNAMPSWWQRNRFSACSCQRGLKKSTTKIQSVCTVASIIRDDVTILLPHTTLGGMDFRKGQTGYFDLLDTLISTSTSRTCAASPLSKSRHREPSPAFPAPSSAAADAATPFAPTVCAAPLSLCAAAARTARLPICEAAAISRSDSMTVSRNLFNIE